MALEPRLLLLPAAAATLMLLALLAPSIQGAGLKTAQALKNAAGSASATRWRFAFVAIQSAVATSLLVGTLLLFDQLLAAPPRRPRVRWQAGPDCADAAYGPKVL
jgi:hypothetical protein